MLLLYHSPHHVASQELIYEFPRYLISSWEDWKYGQLFARIEETWSSLTTLFRSIRRSSIVQSLIISKAELRDTSSYSRPTWRNNIRSLPYSRKMSETHEVLTQNAGKAHKFLQGPPSAPRISKNFLSLTYSNKTHFKKDIRYYPLN
jgi:hypothetical protein